MKKINLYFKYKVAAFLLSLCLMFWVNEASGQQTYTVAQYLGSYFNTQYQKNMGIFLMQTNCPPGSIAPTFQAYCITPNNPSGQIGQTYTYNGQYLMPSSSYFQILDPQGTPPTCSGGGTGCTTLSVSISSNPTTINLGQSATLSATATGGSGNYTYHWSPSLGTGQTKTVSPSTATVYTVTVNDNATGCTATDQFTLLVNTCGVHVNATSSPSTINVGSSSTLNVTATGGSGNYSYAWSNGLGSGTTHTVSPLSNTTYYVTVTDNVYNCSSTDYTYLSVVNPACTMMVSINTSGYYNSYVPFTATPSNGSGNYTYSWTETVNGNTTTLSNTSNQINAYPHNSYNKTFTVTVTDVNTGCTATNTAELVKSGGCQMPSSGGMISVTPSTITLGETAVLNNVAPATGGSGAHGYYEYEYYYAAGPSSAPIIYKGPSGSATWTPTSTGSFFIRRRARVKCDYNTTSWFVQSNFIYLTVVACSNINNGGSITTNESNCGSFDPTVISEATAASGGSGTISYIWEESTNGGTTWTTISGATGTFYDPSTITQTTQYRRGAKRNGCASYVYSNIVTKTVHPAPTLSISPLDSDICLGASETLTAIATNGTTPYTFTWDNGLGTGTTKTISPTSGTTYSVTVTDGNSCTTNASTIIEVAENYTDGGILLGDENICANETPTTIFNTILPSGGSGGTTEYIWQSSPDGSTWATISGATGETYTPPSLTATTHYRRGARRAPCLPYVYSDVVVKTVLSVTNITNAGAIASSETGCPPFTPTTITSTAAPSGGSGGTLEYQWQMSFDNAIWIVIPSANGSTFSPPALAVTTYYRRGARRSPCSIYLYTASVQKTVYQNYTDAGTIAANETNCGSFNPANITSTAAPSGGTSSGSLQYSWEQSTDGGTTWTTIPSATAATYDPSTITQTTQYRRGARRSVCPNYVYSNVITKEVVAAYTTAGTIASDETICYGDTATIITGTLPTGGSGTIEYIWEESTDNGTTWSVIAGAIGQNYQPLNLSDTTRFRRGARGSGCATYLYSNVVTKSLIPQAGDSLSVNHIAYLLASNGQHADRFGHSVDIDGDYAIIGSPSEDQNGNSAGAAYVYKRNNTGNWVEIKKLLASDGQAGDQFGYSVGIDGDYIVIGANRKGFGGSASNPTGAAYVFQKDAGGIDNWGEIKKLQGGLAGVYGNPTQFFGFKVDISGENIIISGSEDFYIFSKNQGGTNNWGLVKFWESRPSMLSLYTIKSISIDAGYVVVGGIGMYPIPPSGSAGSALIFKQNQGGINNWGLLKLIEPSDGQLGDEFGRDVDIEGEYIVVGAQLKNYPSHPVGGIYIFQKDAGGVDNWGEIKTLEPTVLIYSQSYGSNVSISNDNIVTGGPYSTTTTDTYTYIYNKNLGGNNNWGEANNFLSPSVSGGSPYIPGQISISDNDLILGLPFLGISSNPSFVAGAAAIYEIIPSTVTIKDTICQGQTATIGGQTFDSTGVYEVAFTGADGCDSLINFNLLVVDSLTSGGVIAANEANCSAFNPVLITSTAAASGGTSTIPITYQWQSSTDSINWTDITGATSETYDPPNISQTTYYRRSATRLPCTAVYSNVITKEVVAAYTTAGTIASDETICYGDTATIITGTLPTGGSGTIEYIWEESTDNGTTWSVIAGAIGQNYQPLNLSDTTRFRRGARGSGCATYLYSNVVTKNVIPSASNDDFIEIQKLLASDGQAYDGFGGAAKFMGISISGDYAIIGAAGEDQKGNGAGAAYIYKKIGNTWTEIKKLTASDGQSLDAFGGSVSISNNYAIVSATGENQKGTNAGAAYIFEKNTGGIDNWGEVKKITASDGQSYDNFGNSVGISGNYAIIEAYGKLYVLQKDIGGINNWGEVKTITNYGANIVSISGNYIITGDSEAANIYEKNTGGVNNWGKVKTITASDGHIYQYFGSSGVAISGNYAIVGAYGDNDNGSNTGAAYIFEKDAGGTNNWGEVKKIVASDGEVNDDFGQLGVAILGNYAVVGAKGEDLQSFNEGAIYIFEKNTGGTNNWGEVKKIVASDGELNDAFGYHLAISDNYLIVGARDDDNGINAGAAYIFSYGLVEVKDTICQGQTATIGGQTFDSTGVYEVAFTGADGCDSLINFNLLVLDNFTAPTITGFSDVHPICGQNNGSITINFNNDFFQSHIEFSLDGGATFQTPVPDNSGSVTYSNLSDGTYNIAARWQGELCPAVVGVRSLVSTSGISVTASNDQTICIGESATLTATSSGGTGTKTYQWNDNTGSPVGTGSSISLSPTTTTTYSVIVTDQNGCTDNDMVTVTVRDLPTATLSKTDPSSGLNNGSITITYPNHSTETHLQFSLNGGSSYQPVVLDNSGSTTYSNLASGSYTIYTRWGDGGCPVLIGSINLVNSGAPVVAIEDTTICSGTSIILQTTASAGLPPYSFTWSHGLGSGSSKAISPAVTTTYTVTVTDANGATSTDQAIVTVIPLPTATINTTDASCNQSNGRITFTFADEPSKDSIRFSLNGGTTYQTAVGDNSDSVTYTGLAAGTYTLFAKWGDDSCPASLGTVTLNNNVNPIFCNPSLTFEKSAMDNVQTGTILRYTFTFNNNTGVILNNVTFRDTLSNGVLFITDARNTTNGIQVVGVPVRDSIAHLTLNNVPIGTSSFEIYIHIPIDYSGANPFCNQAYLSGLAANNPNLADIKVSDNSNTGTADDKTCTYIWRPEICNNGIDDDLDGDIDCDDSECTNIGTANKIQAGN